MNCTFLDDNKIIIENNVLIALNVQIYTATHHINSKIRFYQMHSTVKTRALLFTIKDNSWIGRDFIILPNVTIGKNVVIGAGSVVTKDIPNNTIAYGNPCCVVCMNSIIVYSANIRWTGSISISSSLAAIALPDLSTAFNSVGKMQLLLQHN